MHTKKGPLHFDMRGEVLADDVFGCCSNRARRQIHSTDMFLSLILISAAISDIYLDGPGRTEKEYALPLEMRSLKNRNRVVRPAASIISSKVMHSSCPVIDTCLKKAELPGPRRARQRVVINIQAIICSQSGATSKSKPVTARSSSTVISGASPNSVYRPFSRRIMQHSVTT